MRTSRTAPLLAAGWSLVFAAPHVFWALGGRAGLGAETAAADRAFDTPWFVAYNAVTALLCVAGLALGLWLAGPGRSVGRLLARVLRVVALVLAVRGAIGLVSLAVGAAHGEPWPPPVLVAVEPWFLLGAVVWWAVARGLPVRTSLTGFVVVSGPPASCKSTLAGALAHELALPLLAKDEIKERLMAVSPPGTVEESRAMGRFAVARLLDEAEARSGAVLDSVWVDRAAAVERLTGLGRVVEVHCRCDPDTLRTRFAARAEDRDPGHRDLERADDELWPEGAAAPLAGGWPVVEVDTTTDVAVADVAARVREGLA